MNKVFIATCICLLAYNGEAQNKYIDSLKQVLVNTMKPIERFTILNKIRENFVMNQDGGYDTTDAIQMHEIAEQLNSDSLLAISYNVIGNVVSDKGDIPGAMEYFFKALPLAEKSKDKRRISSIYLDLSLAYYTLQNYEEGLKYTKIGGENLPERSSAMHDYMAVQFNRNMVRYFLNNKQPDSALRYLHELEYLNHSVKGLAFKTIELALNGKAYDQLGDNEMAEVYFKKANAIADSSNSASIKITARQNYIPYLLGRNRIQEAKQYAIELLSLGYQRNNTRLTAAGYLRRVYDTLHLTDSAYYYSVMESAVRDSIFSQNNINRLQVLAFNEKIRNMDEADRLADEAERRQQNIQYALLAFGIISFLLIFLLLSRSFITNTNVIHFLSVIGLLIVFEFLNLLLHPFLERITNHSPVLMLTGLVFVAAILIPLHHKLEKWATKKLIEKNKQIRLAAAKKTIEKLESGL